MMYLRYCFRSRSTNQSIRYPAISGADLYNKKNLCKLPVAHAHLVCSACLIHSFSLSALDINWNIVVKSEINITYVKSPCL